MTSSQTSTDWVGDAPEGGGNALAMIHRLLRGRYLITITLAGIFAAAGGAAGYLSQEPLFRSDSIVQIQPVLPKILFETEQSSAPQMFSSFVASQAELMQGENVIAFAMESDRWRGVSERAGLTTVDSFRERLSVRSNRASQQLIFVSFEHIDSRVAQAGTQAVVDAYMELHGRTTELGSEARMNVLRNRLRNLQDEKRAVDVEIGNVAQQWGTDQLALQVQAAFEVVQQLSEEQRLLRGQVEDLEALAQRRGGEGGLTPEQAAELDPGVAELLGIRQALLTRRAELISEGILENHLTRRRNQAGLEQVDLQIQERIAALEELGAEGGGGLAAATGVSLDALRTRLQRVEDRLREEQRRQVDLGQANLRLRDLQVQREDIDRQIDQTEQRITAITVESQVGNFSEVSGRISVVSPATMPREPSSDKRRKMAAAGFVGAGAIPVGLMMGLGLIGRRIRYSDDAILDAANSRVVGVLPDLGKSITDRELAEASAFAVHQIRSQLQILYRGEDSAVFAVTSPAPGDGKTSMIIALGLSFAESGDRTLLIDLDLVGRGLSLHFGHPAAPSLADAAARGDDLSGLVHASRFDRLSVLPAGFGDDQRISRLSPAVVRHVIASFRDKYDVILIDSGPILGSIEAGLLAPVVDGMLMVVGRNQLRPLVKRAVDQIIAVGGRVVATVFNRASLQELRQSSSSMSVHFSRQASRQAAEQAASGARTSVGPLGGSLFRPEAEQAGESR